MRMLRSQSAMEFMMTYGYVFLAIAIAVGILVLFLGIPKTTIPFQCNFYSGFTCTDAVLIPSNAGASLIVAAIDNQPGVVNASVFNGVINYQSSTNGFCLPSRILDGQYVYCVANFSFTPVLSNIYYGTFNMSANYCTSQAGNLSTVNCPASNSLTYGGSIRVEPSANSPLTSTLNTLIANAPITFYYAPITITNNQPVGSSGPLQVAFWFPVNGSYAPYLKTITPTTCHHSCVPDNIEFSTLPAERGTVLESWIEVDALGAPGGAYAGNWLIWVDLPQGIQANSSETIYVNFLPYSTVSVNGPLGIAPNIFNLNSYIGVYGTKYDDGAHVFDFYDNFAGRTLSSAWNSVGSLTVSNSLTLPAGSTNYVKSVNSYSALGRTFDLSWEAFAPSVANSMNFGFGAYNAPSNSALYVMGGDYNLWLSSEYPNWIWYSANSMGTFGGPLPPAGSPSTGYYATGSSIYNVVDSIGSYTLTNGITVNYGMYSICNDVGGIYCYGVGPSLASATWVWNTFIYSGIAPLYIQNNVGGVSSGGSAIINWVRIRGSPPDGIMPGASFGNVITQTT